VLKGLWAKLVIRTRLFGRFAHPAHNNRSGCACAAAYWSRGPVLQWMAFGRNARLLFGAV